jgi:kinesin family protein 20
VKIENDHMCVTYAPKESNTYKNAQHRLGKGISQKFSFSKIFTENTGQKQFFDEAVLGTVKEFINGQNCLMFTYGVTNSGKTHTIQGV